MQGAEGAFRAGLAGNPYVSSLNLSHLYFNLQQLDSSLFYAHRAIQTRPFGPGGYVVAAKVFLVRQQEAEAERILLAGHAACEEEFVYGDYLLGGIDVAKGHLARADSIYHTVLVRTSRPQQPEYSIGSEKELFGEDLATLRAKCFHALGRVFAARGQMDSSEVYFRTASQLLPMRLDILADWGVCLLKLNRLDEAERVMRQTVSVDPHNPAMWLNYATVLARKGKYPEARRATEEALRLRPEFPEAQALLQNIARIMK
jgi:tetratricopeptide (TPR) repeat protein